MTFDISDGLDRFRAEALARGIPSTDVERWLGTARRCATLSPYLDGPVVGRFGGPLMLPADVPTPEWNVHLIASLDLAALPEGATDLPLPSDGRLLLLANPDGLEAAYRVPSIGDAVYIPAGTPVEERHIDHGYEDYDEFAELDSELEGELRLRHGFSLPDHDSIIDTAQHPYARELREAWSEVRSGDLDLTKGTQLQIGGYATDEYGELDPVTMSAELAAEAETKGHRPGSGEMTPPEDWALLAQWIPGIDGLEGAFVHWAIRRQDVAARRFDRGYASMFFNP